MFNLCLCVFVYLYIMYYWIIIFFFYNDFTLVQIFTASLNSRRIFSKLENNFLFHIQVRIHRSCLAIKQHRVLKLRGPDISFWTWDHRYDRQQHFCPLPWFTHVDQEGLQPHTSIYDKRDNFHITNFPFLSNNIATSIFISQLIRYAQPCTPYWSFMVRATRLSNKLLE